MLQRIAIRTGFCDGKLSRRAAGFGLPNSSRSEPATADTGFHSAIGCIQPGSPATGTMALDYTTNPGDVDLDVGSGFGLFALPGGANQNQPTHELGPVEGYLLRKQASH